MMRAMFSRLPTFRKSKEEYFKSIRKCIQKPKKLVKLLGNAFEN
jgi:hypothetical protein